MRAEILQEDICILRKIIKKNDASKYKAIRRLERIGEESWMQFNWTGDIKFLEPTIEAFAILGKYDKYDSLINVGQYICEHGYRGEFLTHLKEHRKKYRIPQDILDKIVMQNVDDITMDELETRKLEDVEFDIQRPPYMNRDFIRANKLCKREKIEYSLTEKGAQSSNFLYKLSSKS